MNYDKGNNVVLSSYKAWSIGAVKYWEVFETFQFKKLLSINKSYIRSYHNGLFSNWRRQENFVKRINYTIKSSSHFLPCYLAIILPWSCHYLAMILISVPCIMICHDLEKGTMVNHDLARITMIMASVPWLRILGIFEYWGLLNFEPWLNFSTSFLQCPPVNWI